MKKKAANALTFDDMVAAAPSMRQVVRMGQRAAASNIPVLITGESGVGKELLARAIQGSSERGGRPFIAVNCGAIPENLVESILFGHEKGAFTGAVEKHAGKFVEAHGGTLFLDEVGELPLDMQVKLLRVLQESEVDPVGGKRPVKVDVRIISATNKDLAKLVAESRFREDLFYRLNVFPITIPPLRNRREDVGDLARRFMSRFAAEEGKRIRAVSPEALALLTSYPWPGNVRQLENTLFRAIVLCDGDELSVAEFPQIAAQVDGFDVRVPPLPPMPEPVPVHQGPAMYGDEPVRRDAGSILRDPSIMALLDENGEVIPLAEIEERVIRFALTHYRNHMTEMARRLGIGRSTLYSKMKELGLDDESLGDSDQNAA
jgi:DNA-binding NtrC family response regulator